VNVHTHLACRSLLIIMADGKVSNFDGLTEKVGTSKDHTLLSSGSVVDGEGGLYLRNLLHMSCSFFFVYTAFSAIQNLQTSVLENDAVKTVSPAILYLVFTILSIPGPAVVSRLGAKWSLFIAFIMVCTWCAANAVVIEFPENDAIAWGFLIPSSALVGVGASFLWVAQGTYLTRNAAFYAMCKGEDQAAYIGLFNGIFFGIFQMTQISGNITASILLDVVGASKTVLFLVFMACAIIGTALVFFLRTVEDPNKELAGIAAGKTNWQIAENMVKLWKDNRLQLMIPIIMYFGLEQGFIWGDFTANYITDGLGEDYIGYVMAIYGGSDALSSIALGSYSDTVGRGPVVIFGALVQLIVCAVLFSIDVTELERGTMWGVLMVCAALWGMGDAVWCTQIAAAVGDIFRGDKEGGFANLQFWQSLMISISFGLNFLLGSTVKLSILIVFGVVGVAGFLKIIKMEEGKVKSDSAAAPLLD
jgi:MFS family permease